MNEFIVIAAAEFWNTGAGSMLRLLLQAVGIFVVIGAGLRAFKSFAEGKIGGGLKAVFGGMLLATILFFPETIEVILGTLNQVVTTLIGNDGAGGLVDRSGQPG